MNYDVKPGFGSADEERVPSYGFGIDVPTARVRATIADEPEIPGPDGRYRLLIRLRRFTSFFVSQPYP